MQGFLYEENSFWAFFVITVLMGGGAAWMAGRACARTWRGYGTLAFYLVLLSFGIRFLHYALFETTLLSARGFVIDLVVILVAGFVSYRFNRTRQMLQQYAWLYEAAGPLSWRPKQGT